MASTSSQSGLGSRALSRLYYEAWIFQPLWNCAAPRVSVMSSCQQQYIKPLAAEMKLRSGPSLVFCLNTHGAAGYSCKWIQTQTLSGRRASMLFPDFQSITFHQTGLEQPWTIYCPAKKQTNSVGLKENLASSKVMLCWTFIAFGRREKQGRRSIKEVSVPFVTSGAGHFSCTPFFFFFFTFLKKWSSAKSEGWTFLILEDFGVERYW